MQADPTSEDLVALFSGPLTVGSYGVARTTFDMPAFNGKIRVMATAWSEIGIGQADADVILRDPIVITASAPRFLAPGETFTIDTTAFTGFHRDGTRAILSAGPLARYDVAGLLQRLDRYPYGCTEQTASRAMPLLYLSSGAEALDLGSDDEMNTRIAGGHCLRADKPIGERRLRPLACVLGRSVA